MLQVISLQGYIMVTKLSNGDNIEMSIDLCGPFREWFSLSSLKLKFKYEFKFCGHQAVVLRLKFLFIFIFILLFLSSSCKCILQRSVHLYDVPLLALVWFCNPQLLGLLWHSVLRGGDSSLLPGSFHNLWYQLERGFWVFKRFNSPDLEK